MFDIGFAELLIVGVLALIVLGPERLPKAARTVGLFIGRIRRTMSGIQQEIEQEVRNQEIREKLKDPMRTYLSEEELNRRYEEYQESPTSGESQTSLTPPESTPTKDQDRQ
ncbi:twin-arginine translocase subunit TatB [Bermanella marisrubri]|uniref:Sec-independent protein translocase protein TatB n=1 Tax=Bermanella marisrubri TaxID=207949 RepID=Q1N201_9GAMM|nr:Sec-independent protein translocase protein TatB [Bermanella marisrubri]EAT12363.1 sec-independent translocase [Bermanella marisrubri]QIZ85446.1 twin-arginine translocase subunit TatB [Bermanella marisrubri]